VKKKNITLKDLPLSGVNVLDLTNVLSGPFATLILSDLGANVIKVEKPTGDDSREFGPIINGESGYFISLNRGKKSIVLDLKEKNDKKIFESLLSKVDVLVDNFKPGTIEKFGFSWNYLSKKYPNLIFAKISGFGETGPLKNYPAYDIIVQAMSGIMSITGKNEKDYVRVGTSIGDIVAGLFCVIGILSQLIRRKNLNIGSKLDISMLDCQIAILENAIARYSIEKKVPVPIGTDHPSISPFGLFKTLDRPIVLAAGNNKIFFKLCECLNDSKMKNNSMFKNNINRNKNLKILRKKIEKKLTKKKSNVWIKKFSKKNIPCSLVNNIKDIVNHSQVLDRKMILDYKDSKIDNLKLSGNPLKFSFVKNKKISKKSPRLDGDRKKILKFFGIN